MTDQEKREPTYQKRVYQELRDSWQQVRRLVEARDHLLDRLHTMPTGSEAEQRAYDNVKDAWLRHINLVKEYQAEFWADFEAFDSLVGQQIFGLGPLTPDKEKST